MPRKFVSPLAVGIAVAFCYPLMFYFAEWYGLVGGCTGVTTRPEVSGFMIGSLLMAVSRKEFRSQPAFLVGPLLLGFATGFALPEFFGCPWCVFLQLGYGHAGRAFEAAAFVFGGWLGVRMLMKGFSVQTGARVAVPDAWAKRLVVATAVASACYMAWSLDLNYPRQFLAVGVVILVGAALGAAMQAVRFCVVEGLRNALWFRMPSGFIPVVSMIGGSLLYALLSGTFTPDFLPADPIKGLWPTLVKSVSTALASFAFMLSGGCTVWHAVNAGNGALSGLVFLGGMLLSSLVHKLAALASLENAFAGLLFSDAPKVTHAMRTLSSSVLSLLIAAAVVLAALLIFRATIQKEE